MSIVLHPDAQNNFNEKSQILIKLIKEVQSFKPLEKNEFQPGFYTTGTISKKEIIGNLNIDLVDQAGKEAGKLFFHKGKQFGLIGDDYHDFEKLTHNIQNTNVLRNIISVEFAKETLFEWLVKSFSNNIKSSFVEELINRSEKSIHNYEVWVPIPFTSLFSFYLGKILFKQISKEIIDKWIKLIERKERNEEEMKKLKKYERKFRKNYQGFAAGIYNCKAERIRAHELAYYHINNSLSVLRLFSPANHIPNILCGTYEYGQKMVRTKSFFLINEKENVFSEVSQVIDIGLHWNVDNFVIEKINKGDLSYYNKLLNLDRYNDFQKKLLEAIIIYSKNTLRREIFDKILYILVALESILLRNNTEPIQQNVGDRIAFTIGKNSEERHDIAQTIKDVYSIRSKFIHHGIESFEDKEKIQKFMHYAWLTFSSFVRNMEKFKTKEELINALEKIKYS